MDETDRLMIEIGAAYTGGAAFSAANRDIDQTAASTRKIADEMREAGNAAAGVRDTGSAMAEVGKIAAGVFAGLSISRVVSNFWDFHKSTMAEVAALGSLADRVGVSTDQLQAMQMAARGVNVTNEELNKTVGTFSTNIGKAADGSKAQIEALNKLGVNILDGNGKLRAMTDILPEVARGLVAITNPMERAAVAAALVGDKGTRLTPLMRALSGSMDDLTEAAKASGQVVDRDLVDKLDKAQNAGQAAEQQFRALYAAIGAPIQTKSLENVSTFLGEMNRQIKESGGSWSKWWEIVLRDSRAQGINGFRMASPAEMREMEIDKARAALAKLNEERKKPSDGAAWTRAIDADIARQTKLIQDLTAAENEEARVRARLVEDSKLQEINASPQGSSALGTKNPPVRGSGDGRDRIQEALNKIVLERKAAEKALADMMGNTTTPLKDLERAVDLERKKAEAIAELGKYNPGDPRVRQIEAEVVARENALSAESKWRQAMQDATDIEKRSGDGKLAYRERVDQLNAALATGRMEVSTYTQELKAAADAADLARLKHEGAKGGVEGLIAGMQYAAKQWEINNSSFVQGQRVFERVTSDMGSAFSKLRRGMQVDMGEILGSWVDMLIQMQLQAAASEVFKYLNSAVFGSGGLGGWLGGLFNSGGGGSPGGSVAGSGMGGAFPAPFADGGDPPVGKVSIVGERGPELFYPKTAGTIMSHEKLMALLGAGGGRSSGPAFVQENHFHGGVTEADIGRMLPQIAAASADLVQDRVKRGGSYGATWR